LTGTSFIGFTARLVVCAGIWQFLNWGDPASWLVGAPVVFAAALLSRQLSGAGVRGFRWQAVPGFFLYFLRSSLAGGLDVSRRVFDPRLPVSPGFVDYHPGLPPGPGRVLFVNMISLLPGTVSAGLEGDRLIVHALDAGANVESELRSLEERVGRLFGGGGGA